MDYGLMSKITSLFIAYFLFIALIPCSNAFSSCTRDSDCDYYQYCLTGGMNENVCSSCNHPDNTYSWSWVTNGQRKGTGINSCQWKIQCGKKPDFQNGTWAPDNKDSTGYDSVVSDNNGGCKYTNSNRIAYNSGYYRV